VEWKRRIVVVHGYGCNLDSPLTGYLERVLNDLERDPPERIILCGGYTQRKGFPEQSEAEVMRDFINERTGFEYAGRIWCEINSYTTLENTKEAVRFIRTFYRTQLQDIEITVYCEAQRALKTLLLYWFLLPELRRYHKRIRLETVSWELAHPLKELVKTNLELIALFLPPLAWWMHRMRIKRAERI
jgi:hypothetical protein